ncbi:MAG: Holliday junction resolvase RuvX [Pyrinomonadaceae bacterium]
MPIHTEITELSEIYASGRILALDPGLKRIGVAISDPDQIIATPLELIERRSWKHLLSCIKSLITTYDAKALVIGLPLGFEGKETEMSILAREWQRKFALSLSIPVFLEDERVSSYEAMKRLWISGKSPKEASKLVDSESAVVILETFLQRLREQAE